MVAHAVSEDARAVVLGRIRSALIDVPDAEPASWELPAAEIRSGQLDLLCERIADYRARVTRVVEDSKNLGSVVAEVLKRHRAERIAVPADLPAAWRPPGVELLVDEPPLTHEALGALDGVLTGAALAIAETGTIVLDGGPGQGRRALSLLPDLHVCVLDGTRVLATVADAIAALGPTRRPVTLISGPSATSDIEFKRVEGVHGPRRLEVIVLG
jgi:L-lactate dehydrogenase complex protein LldG